MVGASGLLGHHVRAQLLQRGHEVTAVARTARDGIDRAVDVSSAGAERLRDLLAGHDGLVFAGGMDDRVGHKRPVAPALHAGNVVPAVALLRAAGEVGCTRAVVLGSYYTYFARTRPDWQLAAKHPYVRSRIEQARLGRAAAGPDLPVAVLEVPYVFGSAPGRVPMWSVPLFKWARSRSPLYAPPGGSPATSAAAVGAAAAEALERASGEDLPVVQENLTWHDMFGRIAEAVGRPRVVRRAPAGVVRALLRLGGAVNRLAGNEPGLAMKHLDGLLLDELFIEPTSPRSVDEAIAQTARGQTWASRA
ncbi:hypothetical protein GCM10010174_77540 [Kutzneria viridogrisea]